MVFLVSGANSFFLLVRVFLEELLPELSCSSLKELNLMEPIAM